MNISMRQLEALSAIARNGKIVIAAKELGLTPPAVTLQLKAAEDDLGIMLFERLQGGLRPTAAGECLLEAAHAIAEQLRTLEDRIGELKGLKRGRLYLGVVSTAKYFAPRIMAAFMKVYPGLTVELKVGNRAEIIAALRDHEIDVALMGRPPKEFPVRANIFGDHPLVIVAAPDHRLVLKRDISKSEIASEHFLVREPGSGTRMSLEIFFASVKRKAPNLGPEMGSNETIKQAVMAGLGVAFISAHTIEAEVQSGRLAVLDVEGMPIRRQWFSVSRADRIATPAMMAFEAYLVENGAQFLPMVGSLYRAPQSGQ